MKTVTLDHLLSDVRIVHRSTDTNPAITEVVYDSRKVSPGALFVALSGSAQDGHDYVHDAVRRGASAVLCERLSGAAGECVIVQVADTRRALSSVAAALYGRPSKELVTIGVTGTDGKSTTVYLIHQLLEAAGVASGFLSTPMIQVENEIRKNPFRNSTPESLEVHRILRDMVSSRRTHAVIEATSHGLSARTSRLADVAFDCGVLTNITHEHLEFHGTFEQYRSDKGNLFRALDDSPAGVGIVNLDDPSAAFFSSVSSRPVYTYSIERSDADTFATGISVLGAGAGFDLHYEGRLVHVKSPLPGEYNVSNLLAALLAVTKGARVPLDAVLPAIADLRSLPGRMDALGSFRGAEVIIDYAHTPGAFAKLLPALKGRQASEGQSGGRLIVVFGSAGERDTEKRALQGAVADEHADVIVLTDEDPRGDNPLSILEDIAAPMARHRRGEDLFLIPDRRKAVRHALESAGAGDVVALLGKGHESTIIYADGPIPWNEAEVARATMSELNRESGNEYGG